MLHDPKHPVYLGKHRMEFPNYATVDEIVYELYRLMKGGKRYTFMSLSEQATLNLSKRAVNAPAPSATQVRAVAKEMLKCKTFTANERKTLRITGTRMGALKWLRMVCLPEFDWKLCYENKPFYGGINSAYELVANKELK